ncbi:hypothetical protein ACFQQB_43495 [Nonomuraea rubra]|uniref:hypothetical protein n=1 Tax=Nonomuraea rubra TaxID=46180 RepID=UPI00360A25FD
MSSRWKPTVTPRPVTTYRTAASSRSVSVTPCPHARAIATPSATNGTTTIVAVSPTWSLPAGACSSAPGKGDAPS